MEKVLSTYMLAKTMGLTEFNCYCKEWSQLRVIYSEENQKRNMECPLFLQMSFDEVMISYNPNAVHLKNNNGVLTVGGINKIELYTGGVGDVIILYCKSSGVLSKYKLIFD